MKAEDVLRPDAPKKNILIGGDGMLDVYVRGRLEGCQDACPKFVESSRVSVLGSAANAQRSLLHSGSVALWPGCGGAVPTKRRFLDGGKIVFRYDVEDRASPESVDSSRRFLLEYVESGKWDGVYLADYDKGFFTGEFMQQVIAACEKIDLQCRVVDPKRDPKWCHNAYLKCNGEFALEWGVLDHSPGAVITHGHEHPTVFDESGVNLVVGDGMFGHVECRNHVGAGDCFGAWLALGLAHGLRLQEAARLAHAAGRVYVQHPHNRPPWPHEIAKELDPVLGKVVSPQLLGAVRESVQGRVVFTNGVFRLPHAGHFWLLDFAKRQGDVLVVGVNGDVSAFRQRPGEFCLPLEARLAMIACHSAVDYVVVFEDDTPIQLVETLKPEVVVKGADYGGKDVCGSSVCAVVIAPHGPFTEHASDILKAIAMRG